MQLTGRQNSSKAGFTNFVYCCRTDSNVLARSVISRSTANEENAKTNLALKKKTQFAQLAFPTRLNIKTL